MKTVRRLLYFDVLTSVAFVAVSFLALFFFIDIVDELERVGRGGYEVQDALLHCLLQLPGHLYELMPIAVLIGTIYAMARMAQSSEFTILRTSGLGPVAALSLLMGLGVGFAVLTFVIGDYVAPYTDEQAQVVKAEARGTSYGRSGTWLKDRLATPKGDYTYSIRIQSVSTKGALSEVVIFEFDPDARLASRIAAATARIRTDAQGKPVWHLEQVRRSSWQPSGAGNELVVTDDNPPSLDWPSTLSQSVVTAAIRPLGTMSAVDLFRYMTHLADNEQAAQRYEIQFWKKTLYPLACLVMVALALPFAYLHGRSGGISLKVFGGIMLGISFVLLNNISTHVGLLQNWTPWVAAATPSAVYLMISLLAFNWLVRHR